MSVYKDVCVDGDHALNIGSLIVEIAFWICWLETALSSGPPTEALRILKETDGESRCCSTEWMINSRRVDLRSAARCLSLRIRASGISMVVLMHKSILNVIRASSRRWKSVPC